jgi:hypothetical protein
MFFDSSILGNGRVPLIAELGESTKSSHSNIVSTTFSNTQRADLPVLATLLKLLRGETKSTGEWIYAHS